MKRVLGRVSQRIQGNHPRRPKSNFSWLVELAADVLLASAAIAFLAGLALLVWALLGSLRPVWLFAGLALTALGPALLYLWERLSWKLFSENLAELT